MARTDLWRPSATRIELDQRSREARLRLEHAERLLELRLLPRQSLLRRLLRFFRARVYAGGQIEPRSAITTLMRKQRREKSTRPGETGAAAGESCAAALTSASASTAISWRGYPKRARTNSVQPNLIRPSRRLSFETAERAESWSPLWRPERGRRAVSLAKRTSCLYGWNYRSRREDLSS